MAGMLALLIRELYDTHMEFEWDEEKAEATRWR